MPPARSNRSSPRIPTPASQSTAERTAQALFSYSDNYLIDTDHGVIVDVEVTRSIRHAEVGSTQAENDQYICPEGHKLKQFRRNHSDPNRVSADKGVAKYRGSSAPAKRAPEVTLLPVDFHPEVTRVFHRELTHL